MTRDDPELGTVRRCATCREYWPDDAEFYRYREGRLRSPSCNACRRDRENQRPIPLRPVTHGRTIDLGRKRARDRVRKAALRRDPVLGDKLRARNREAQRRFYWRNRAACLESSRAEYAARLDRPVRVGMGRPRVAV